MKSSREEGTLEGAQFQKRSFSLKGHKTSVALEKAFWVVLEKAAASQGLSLAGLVTKVDESRSGNLASALRLYALHYKQEVSL